MIITILIVMGTRGYFGFLYKNIYYLFYNHNDSYPSGLGATLIAEIKAANMAEWLEMFLKLKFVSDDISPNVADVVALEPWTDLTVSNGSTQDWYCLLRKTQGSYSKTLKSGYAICSKKSNLHQTSNQLFDIEWTYILNLETQTFTVYNGKTFLSQTSISDL